MTKLAEEPVFTSMPEPMLIKMRHIWFKASPVTGLVKLQPQIIPNALPQNAVIVKVPIQSKKALAVDTGKPKP